MNKNKGGADPLKKAADGVAENLPVHVEGTGVSPTTENTKPSEEPVIYADEPVNLKAAAAECSAAVSTLKNWVKGGKLSATQAAAKAPYMVRLRDVAELLKKSSAVASVFHPKAAADVPGPVPMSPLNVVGTESATQLVQSEHPRGSGDVTGADASGDPAMRSVATGSADAEVKSPVAKNQVEPVEEPQRSGKRRRRRRPRRKEPAPTAVRSGIDSHLAACDLRELINLDRKIKSLIDLKLA